MKLEELAEAFLQYYRTDFEEASWAWEEVMYDLCPKDAKKGLTVSLELIKRCKNNQELAFVAAGPVETLLVYVGTKVIPGFEDASEQSENVKVALSSAFINDEDSVFPEWKRLMEKFGYWGQTPLSPLDRGYTL